MLLGDEIYESDACAANDTRGEMDEWLCTLVQVVFEPKDSRVSNGPTIDAVLTLLDQITLTPEQRARLDEFLADVDGEGDW